MPLLQSVVAGRSLVGISGIKLPISGMVSSFDRFLKSGTSTPWLPNASKIPGKSKPSSKAGTEETSKQDKR